MNDFKDGKLHYSAKMKKARDIVPPDLASWDDGFMAFSNKELRLRDLRGVDVKELLGKRINDVPGADIPNAEGYLMELNLWRYRSGGVHEELVVEREDDQFFVQWWELNTSMSAGEQGMHSFWRPAETRPRGHSLFLQDRPLKSVEVIVPHNRLHFFITNSRDDN